MAAGNQFKILIPIHVLDQTGPAMRGISNRFSRFAKSAAFKSIAGIGKGLGKITAITGSVSALAIGHKIFTFGSQFERALTRAGFAAQATTEQMQALRDEISKVARETPFDPEEIAGGSRELSQAGLTVAESIATLRKVADFATAAEEGFPLEVAADLLTRVAKTLEVPLDTTDQLRDAFQLVSDTIVRGAIASQTSMPELVEALTHSLYIGRANNQSFFDIVTGLAILSDAGFKSEEGGVALKNVFMRLGAARETPEVKKALVELGLHESDLFDRAGRLLPIEEILAAFSKSSPVALAMEKMKEMEDSGMDTTAIEDKIEELVALNANDPDFGSLAAVFAQRSTGPFLSMMSGYKKGMFPEFRRMLGDPSGPTANTLNEQLMSGTGGTQLRLASAWQDFLIRLSSSGALVAITNGLEGLIAVMDKAAASLPQNKAWLNFMERAFGATSGIASMDPERLVTAASSFGTALLDLGKVAAMVAGPVFAGAIALIPKISESLSTIARLAEKFVGSSGGMGPLDTAAAFTKGAASTAVGVVKDAILNPGKTFDRFAY